MMVMVMVKKTDDNQPTTNNHVPTVERYTSLQFWMHDAFPQPGHEGALVSCQDVYLEEKKATLSIGWGHYP